MDKARKKNIKRITAIVCLVAVVALLAAMPLIARQDPQADGPKASILSGTVETGSIRTALMGGGTLAEEDAVTVSVPSAVKLTEYLVSNGDSVSEGDPIAAVDRVTVMLAISEVQETLDHLAEEIETEREKDTNTEVIALAGGIVKLLYAEEGKSVQDVMLEHGALAVLSLDGLMAVKMRADAPLAVGSDVTVTLPDGTALPGKVEANLAGEMTVTVEDEGYAIGEAVQVAAEDGTALGSGELYIYSPWNATAYAGTIDSIEVREGETVDAGETLIELVDTGHTAAYRQLTAQRQAYEELMLELFRMYQTELITAPCDGVVSGVDKNSIQLLAAAQPAYTVTLLSNAPNGDDETLYTNFVGQVSAVGSNGWAVSLNPQNLPIADYMDLSGVPLDTSAMTELVIYDPAREEGAAVPVYELQEGAWVQTDAAGISAGDILLFAGDTEGSFVWIVRINKAPEAPTQPAEPSVPTIPDVSGGNSSPEITYPSIGGSWGSTGSFPQGGMTEQTPAFELYDLAVTQVAAVTPQSVMTLDISIDELDITALKTGMSAEVMIDALGGEKVTATITAISNTGTNNGGSSKFTVELTLDRGENMLAGMTATAAIVLETTDDVLTLPASALVENGTKTIVYTGYDEENGILTDPVTVTVGVSDGETVEILDGLSAGATYYYAYYDTVEISVTPDFGGRFPFGSQKADTAPAPAGAVIVIPKQCM